MVRRHSVPPHALKRQNSRFKIGAGVAAAAGAGDNDNATRNANANALNSLSPEVSY